MRIDEFLIMDDEQPIYLQIVDTVKRLCASGKLCVGDELPSARCVAKHLGVNPMTVSKAYKMLVEEAYLVRERGKKMRIAGNLYMEKEARFLLLKPFLDRLVNTARQLNINNSSLLFIANDLLKP